ncbi:hypothetical protein [Heyndrickxia sporothermodurans]|nr:hypothetical protein [Heyndrickxia sporothermodurans]MBL5794032.1 hypothetical protein [Heyndrickxia sporothermodurans]PTY89238.1 hypothetical protein B5V90_08265 [Heyndrickxia sporothermodurans]
MRCLNGGLLVNYHYTRFGEVLLFLSLKPLDTQGLRIMKFIQIDKSLTVLHQEIQTITREINSFRRAIQSEIERLREEEKEK